MDRSLSAILAVRNAQFSLRAAVFDLLDVLPELTSRFELVIIDDCSTDATIEVADELAAVYPQLLAVRHPQPLGYWAAIRTGIERSLGEVVFFADQHCELPLNHMRRLWAELGQYDFVVGSRVALNDIPTAIRGSALSRGGYQMGYRRVLLAVADSLGDSPALAAMLQQCGFPWREIETAGATPQWGRGLSVPAFSGSGDGLKTVAERSLRTDRPDAGPSKPKQRNFETQDTKNSRPEGRYLHPAANLVQ